MKFNLLNLALDFIQPGSELPSQMYLSLLAAQTSAVQAARMIRRSTHVFTLATFEFFVASHKNRCKLPWEQTDVLQSHRAVHKNPKSKAQEVQEPELLWGESCPVAGTLGPCLRGTA